jgi:hypothetical protein
MGILRHLQSQFHLRPQSEANKNAPGYTANGMRDAQEVSVKVYKNGNLIQDSGSNKIPNKAVVVFDEFIEDERIQLELSGTASELRCVAHSTDYEYQDKRGWPSEITMEESDYQAELSRPLVWISRGVDPTINQATGEAPASGSIFSQTTGPDGKSDSAMVFSAASFLNYTLNYDFDGDFTLMFALSDIFTENEVIDFSNGAKVSLIIEDDGTPLIEFYDGVRTYQQEIDWNGRGWAFIFISRSGDRLIFALNGVQLSSKVLSEINTFGGAQMILSDNEPKYIYDIRLYDTAVSMDANLYYINNILDDNGSAVLNL